MRLSRLLVIIGVAFIIAVPSATYAGPAHADLILARTGIGRLVHAGSRLVASFDYDQDGDVDLFVGTPQDAIVWVNEGGGLFSSLRLQWTGKVAQGSPMTWVATISDATAPLDRTKPASPRARALVLRDNGPAASFAGVTVSQRLLQVPSISSPRAPPQF